MMVIKMKSINLILKILQHLHFTNGIKIDCGALSYNKGQERHQCINLPNRLAS